MNALTLLITPKNRGNTHLKLKTDIKDTFNYGNDILIALKLQINMRQKTVKKKKITKSAFSVSHNLFSNYVTVFTILLKT